MNNSLLMDFTVDKKNSTVKIKREFEAPLTDVWAAWTQAELLDQWWAPQPWLAKTKSMNFKVGGRHLYAMVGPNGEEHWALSDFTEIKPNAGFKLKDAFCDSEGNVNRNIPGAEWTISFAELKSITTVSVQIKYNTLADLEKIIEMGFKEGFTMALQNLDQYFSAKFKLRNELKTHTGPRVTTYLNFSGNTEEAFNFYKKVFGTEFGGKGIQRFGDIPAEAGHPPVADNIKKMVLHVELPILGGHVLMATDAPKEMGFTLTSGNNMHICLEPTTKAETKKLFGALSKGGNITMPLADMFFGSYFGECTDKYGINWMFNCVGK